VLVGKCRQALREVERTRLLIGGGVAANAAFRSQVTAMCEREGAELVLAPSSLCTDNAAMAGLAWEHIDSGRFAAFDCDVMPGLVRI